MKTARLINAAIWVAIGIALVVGVCYEWHKQGCGWDSLWAAIAMYGTFSIGFCLFVDEHIKEYYKRKEGVE